MRQRKALAGAAAGVDLDEKVRNEGPSGAYEALQLYRSRAIRFKSKGDVLGAINVTAGGAKCLLENSYETAGAELAMLFIDIITEYFESNPNNESSKTFYDLIIEIDNRFPANSSGTLRSDFLKGSVKWSIQTGSTQFGDATLQCRLGEELWRLKDKNSTSHFAAAEKPKALWTKILEFFPSNDAEDQKSKEKALTLGIVHFLALENLRDANELMRLFKKHSHVAKSPLIQFCEYLLQTCRRDAAPLFKQLVNTYASEVDFDEAVPAMLMGPIASKFFHIKPKMNPMMSMLQSMLA